MINSINPYHCVNYPKNYYHPPLWRKIISYALWFFATITIVPIALYFVAKWLVLPAASPCYRWCFDRDRKANRQNWFSYPYGSTVTLKTPDGEVLDGFFYDNCKALEKVILFLPGNGATWEGCERIMTQLNSKVGCSVMAINPRGVGISTGSPTGSNLELDSYTAYRYLIDERGMKPKDILLVGHSFGCGYGSLGAAHIQEEYPDQKISAVSLSSFRDLVSVLDGQGCCGTLAQGILRATGWQIDTKAAWDTLKGRKLAVHHPQDTVIPYSSSMMAAGETDSTIEIWDLSEAYQHNQNPHCCQLTDGGFRILCAKLREILFKTNLADAQPESNPLQPDADFAEAFLRAEGELSQ